LQPDRRWKRRSKQIMLLLVLALVTARGTASALDTPLQICLGQAEGGLGCRCTTTYTAVVDPSLNVDCSSRNLSALPVEWQISQDARHLDLSRNQLSSLVKEQFSHWGNLEELILSRNIFAFLNEGVFLGLTNLRKLDLSYNMLTSLPEQIFSGLPVLSELNLEMNRLQDMHPDVFASMPHLDSLHLGYNTDLGKSIMKSADFLTVALKSNLSYLALNNMSITTFPNNLFSTASQLRDLSLADNPMKSVEMFPASLDTLNLSGIEVEVIQTGDFISYPKLKKLHLDRLIHLKSVQKNAFEGLKSLEVLTMENCIQLQEFDEQAFGGPQSVAVPLERLSLSRCGLHTLSCKTLVPLEPTLEYLQLDGNPWRCDCDLVWIRQTNFSLAHTEYLRCFSPEQHHNKLLLSVKPEDFVCTNESVEQAGYSVLVIVLNVFLIVAILLFCGVILVIMRHRIPTYCTPRKAVGSYSKVVEPNRAELEWDDRDLEHIWSTPGTRMVH